MHATRPLLDAIDFPALRRRRLETVQANLGYRCNQACLHCHVNAGPTRREAMSRDTAEAVLELVAASGATTLDLTGGAPELNPHFRWLVETAHARGVQVMDRCNLTILSEPGHEDLADFLAAHRVEVVASLPCYLEDNVDGQRGAGVYARSIAGLRQLNALGYGDGRSGLMLNLVYNPTGPYLPPPQAALEADYRRELGGRHGIVFDRLFTLANMPIQRFGSTLVSHGEFDAYMTLLRGAHRDDNLDQVMCRTLVSVGWDGTVYDCDFNQMLGLPLAVPGRTRPQVRDLIGRDLAGNPIAVAGHCYGCTAGQGSSCGGALK
ncbi:arsenosugar biosynthesis radical SAM (seleno)protein ArsS [Plasticicumulans sp.]|uniref:arsenosugar biosynthesis radical SAM (seleno)protein ArsS n=1 Tax=Plasticicumulans sp. TaxID=2307179 RepID=UPI002CA303CF|nr:arsenosugar biosynthesis radical SAM (seleno)protein ArsS [Plasticicumulans sp.]HMX54781.1 arsenosugar biosynthesis radical SAM protein ArsS [Plasticicumulans sp.]HNM43038.1 arsenosugar biosynthesis radical SAM protein ArsS [Plasticicumulans sp.]